MSTSDADRDLDELFALARTGSAAMPSSELLARVMAGAEQALQDVAEAGRPIVTAAPGAVVPRRIWSQVAQALGGWGGIGGLAAASFAGLWLGLAGVGGDFGLYPGNAITADDLAPDVYALLAVEE